MTPRPSGLRGAVLALAWAVLALPGPVRAQSPAAPCGPAPEQTAAWQGEWLVHALAPQASANTPPTRGVLQLGPHPEWAGSLRGQWLLATQALEVVADWDEDTWVIEESADGQRIQATWTVQAVPGQCGRELVGRRWLGVPGQSPSGPVRLMRLRQ